MRFWLVLTATPLQRQREHSTSRTCSETHPTGHDSWDTGRKQASAVWGLGDGWDDDLFRVKEASPLPPGISE